MTSITANATELMEQASMTADAYLRQAIERIDSHLGKGYAAQHPELIGAFMQTAAIDFGAATLSKVIGEAIENAKETTCF